MPLNDVTADCRHIPLRNNEEDLIDERRALKRPQRVNEHGDTGQRQELFRNVASHPPARPPGGDDR